MLRKRTPLKDGAVIDYQFEKQTYQIDLGQKKVYRRFIEIETSKAAVILSSWRSHRART